VTGAATAGVEVGIMLAQLVLVADEPREIDQ
jgi:hypothetical protein